MESKGKKPFTYAYGEDLPEELTEVQNQFKKLREKLVQKALGVVAKKDIIDGKWSAPDQN